MARNPYRDIPREQARIWFDQIREYVDGGKIHDDPESVARYNDLFERLWDQIPRLTERPYYWLYRALWFTNDEIERFRRDGRVTLSGRPFMSWSRHPKTAANSNGLGLIFGSSLRSLVVVSGGIKSKDIFVDVDSLGRRAGYRITQFQWNGGEREFIVRHDDSELHFDSNWVQIFQTDRLAAGDYASIRLDGKMDEDDIARLRDRAAKEVEQEAGRKAEQEAEEKSKSTGLSAFSGRST